MSNRQLQEQQQQYACHWLKIALSECSLARRTSNQVRKANNVWLRRHGSSKRRKAQAV